MQKFWSSNVRNMAIVVILCASPVLFAVPFVFGFYFGCKREEKVKSKMTEVCIDLQYRNQKLFKKHCDEYIHEHYD